MDRKSLSFPFQLKAAPTPEGIFEGYCAVFGNLDRVGDVILPGAFSNSLKTIGTSLPILWQHDITEVIGVCLDLTEDTNGLFVRGQLAIATEDGKDAYELPKLGAIKGMSIGYSIPSGGATWDNEIRKIREIQLYEVSLVTFPANESATVTSVKGDLTERDLEKALRDAGLSRTEAKAVIADGFKAIGRQRDADDTSLIDALTAIYRS
jgi:HK97 family phage prohead protease